MNHYIQAVATAVPECALTTARAAQLLRDLCPDPRTARMLPRLLPHTGIERRHLSIMETQTSLDDADGLYRRPAVQPHGPGMHDRSKAFDAASERIVTRLVRSLASDDLIDAGALVTVSCTHASSPGLERAVYSQTSMQREADRWHLGFMGCSAALAALRLAVQRDASKTLVVACELSSLHFQYSADVDQLTANLLFSDGAAAIIVGPAETAIGIVKTGCAAIPEAADLMVWWAGDHGMRLTLSPTLPDVLARRLGAVIEQFLSGTGVSAAQIDHWLVHPGGPQILDAAGAALNLPAAALEHSRAILRDYGNMSSPTIVFILRRLLESGGAGRTMLIAFGPGLTVEMALLDIRGPSACLLRGPAVGGQARRE